MSVDGVSPGPSLSRRGAGPRLPLVVFALVDLIALPVLLHLGRARWFISDDWFFLVTSTTRKFTIKTALTPNTYGHWLTLPLLTYRLFFRMFGLRFKAYLLLVIVLHLVTAALLRAVMRRCGAGPWISTVAASTFVFLGPGADGIFNPVQITFDGSLVFGLTHLLLADHEGKVDRRDVVGLACGLAGLMCSNVSIGMVATVGIAVWWRRGWRTALLHTVPLASVYLAWWYIYARRAHGLLAKRASLGELWPFIRKGWRATFAVLEHFPDVGHVLILIFAVGLVLAWTQATDGARRGSAAAAALALGAVIFIASAGLIRASPTITPAYDSRYLSRYVNVSAAMVLPALAVAASALARRWRQLAPIMIIVLLVGLPGNYHQLATFGASFPKNYKHRFLVLAHSPVAPLLPRSMRVPLQGFGFMTAGWMISGVKSGRIPEPGPVTEQEAANAALDLQLSPYKVARRHGVCRLVPTNAFVLQTGDQILAMSGAFYLTSVADSGEISAPMYVVAGRRFQVFAGPLSVRVLRVSAHRPAIIEQCTPPHAKS